MADDPASALDGIRADHEAANAFGANASDPVPRLIAAVEAALKLADDWVSTPQPEDGGDRAGVAVEQIILDGIELRRAIAAALTGKGEGNA